MKISKKICFIIAMSLIFVVGISATLIDMAKMADKSINDQEVYEQAKVASQGQAIINLVDKELLNKDYSYDKNEKVKQKVKEQLDNIKQSNPSYLEQYDAKDDLDFLNKTNTLYNIQKDLYTKDAFNKEFINDKVLKELYDKKAGELVSYYVIQFNLQAFENNQQNLDNAINDVKTQLSKASDKDVESIFKDLIKKYPGQQQENTFKDAVVRDDVDETLLKTLDSYKFLQFSKEPIDINDTKYFILKMDKSERASFEASKDRLKDYKFTKDTQANQYLVEYLMFQLREKNKVEFKDNLDKAQYDAANKQIVDNYNKAKKEANK